MLNNVASKRSCHHLEKRALVNPSRTVHVLGVCALNQGVWLQQTKFQAEVAFSDKVYPEEISGYLLKGRSLKRNRALETPQDLARHIYQLQTFLLRQEPQHLNRQWTSVGIRRAVYRTSWQDAVGFAGLVILTFSRRRQRLKCLSDHERREGLLSVARKNMTTQAVDLVLQRFRDSRGGVCCQGFQRLCLLFVF